MLMRPATARSGAALEKRHRHRHLSETPFAALH
jgi:hypothetical protein